MGYPLADLNDVADVPGPELGLDWGAYLGNEDHPFAS